jgi:hypothetical protein
MPTVNDPQNPVHFVPNDQVPTEMNKSKVNYGLPPGISDGPRTENLGVVVAPAPNPSASFPSGAAPVYQPGLPVPVFSKIVTASQGPIPPPVVASGASNVGVLHPPPPRPVSTVLPAPVQASGAVSLGSFQFVPEAGAKPENPA